MIYSYFFFLVDKFIFFSSYFYTILHFLIHFLFIYFSKFLSKFFSTFICLCYQFSLQSIDWHLLKIDIRLIFTTISNSNVYYFVLLLQFAREITIKKNLKKKNTKIKKRKFIRIKNSYFSLAISCHCIRPKNIRNKNLFSKSKLTHICLLPMLALVFILLHYYLFFVILYCCIILFYCAHILYILL